MSRAVMQQTLEAYLSREMPAGTVIGDPKWWAPKIAAALEAALAQPEQEPVAPEDTISNRRIISEDPGATISIMQGMQRTIDRLKAKPEQELVVWGVDWGRNGDRSCVSIVKKHPGGHIEVVATENDPKPSHPPRHQPMRRATIEDARDYLNTNDKAMWAIGWNECVEAYSIKGAT